jgi:integrase
LFGRKATQSPKVASLVRTYLGQRSDQLRPGGFKSVRYSLGLFNSRYGHLVISELGRDEGKEFLGFLPQLSTLIGKDPASCGRPLDWLLDFSKGRPKITARTQRRIWSQVNHFLTWVVYEGVVEQNPFSTVRFDRKVQPSPYAVPTDREVAALLSHRPRDIAGVLRLCLLTGMRSGEAVGLLREDIVTKGNLGAFIRVQPNRVRQLKTATSEREVPVHAGLTDLLDQLPSEGRLFPRLSVNIVTKRFTEARQRTGLGRPGLVFHSTRKWFITQCERTGVPEHWTASLVGHQSARSENQLTYAIYSAGISDEQKRSIVDQIRLPA